MSLAVALLLSAALGSGGSSDPNVVIILLDDVGRDKIAAYGDHPSPPSTPNIDALAARGMLFRRAWAYPTCSPTRAALMSGRHSDRTGIGTIISPSDGVQSPLLIQETILPEALPAHHSFTLGKWHLGDGAPTHAFDSGFDGFIGFVGRARFFDWQNRVTNGATWPESGYFPAALTRHGLDVLERIPEPYLVYHCPALAHAPFHVPPQQLHSQGTPPDDAGKHLAMVEALDTLLGTLLQRIDLSTTYVFVIGDNGSPNRTVLPPWNPFQNKRTPYESGVRVPFIVAGPGVAAGTECDELVCVTDVFATVRELVGLAPVAGMAEDSISFAPLLADPSRDGARDHLYFHQFPFPGTVPQVSDVRAIRTKRWKLIEDRTALTFELYDLLGDPFETHDLLRTNPSAAAISMKERLLALMPTFP